MIGFVNPVDRLVQIPDFTLNFNFSLSKIKNQAHSFMAAAGLAGGEDSSQDSSRENIGDLKKFLEFQNMLLISEMICRAALLRTESRGSHFRSDFPEEDNTNWLKNIIVRKEGVKMKLETVPVFLDPVSFEE